MKLYYDKMLELEQHFELFFVRWVPRNQNKEGIIMLKMNFIK